MDARGQIIRARRKELELTMAQAAGRCGVTEATISRIEAGKMPKAGFDTLDKISAGLGIPLDELRQRVLQTA